MVKNDLKSAQSKETLFQNQNSVTHGFYFAQNRKKK